MKAIKAKNRRYWVGIGITAFAIFIAVIYRPLSRDHSLVLPTPSISLKTTTTPTKTTEIIFPPLYPNIAWKEGTISPYTINIGSEKLTYDATTYFNDNINADPNDILTYYKQKLSSTGWKEVDYALGITGSSTTYENQDNYITIQVNKLSRLTTKDFQVRLIISKAPVHHSTN